MDFNIYLTIKPEEWEVNSNNQIVVKKRLPSNFFVVIVVKTNKCTIKYY